MDLTITDARCPLVRAVWVTEIVGPDPVPVDRRPRRVGRVPALGRRAEEPKPLRPEWVDRLLHLAPGHFHVPNLSHLGVGGLERDAVILGPDERARRHDDVR